jgi:hypothetical protein
VNVKVGDTILVRAFAQNNVATNGARREPPSARGTRFNLAIPSNSSSELPITGYISARNATPHRIHDTVFLHSNKRFSIEYKWGSAALLTRAHGVLPLSDDILGEGALIGSDSPNGILLPGLSNYATVYMMLRIVPPAA